MEEEKAHELYKHLQRFDASARHKKGLGFGSETSNNDAWKKSSKFITFRKEGEAPPPTIERGSPLATENEGGGERRKRSRSRRDVSRDRSRYDQGRDRSRDGKEGRRKGRREKRSRSGSPSSRSLSREKRRRKDKHRRDRDRSSSRSRRRDNDRRSRRHRSRSSDYNRRSDRSRGDRSKRGKFVKSEGLSVDWSGHPTTEKTEYSKRIPGFDSMTSVDQLKAKARYLEDRFGAANQESLAIHHSALQEGKSDMQHHCDEVAEEMPTVLHTGILDTTRRLERAHEDAIFGKGNSGPNSSSQPVAVSTTQTPAETPPHTTDAAPEKGPLVSTQVILSQKTTSWRERAAWIKQRREGGT